MSARDNDPELSWGEDAVPRSGRFGDVYFSAQDGLAESRAVFLAGCGLPDRWAGRDHFTVAELGFGTGLNIVALLDLWRRERPVGGRLHIFSVEAFPMAREEAARALQRWPDITDVAAALLARWPSSTPGYHRIDLPELHAVLDLAVMDGREALAAWDGQADAWFLDGFAPASNPGLWSDDILALVAARSAPGTTAATFTVAGAVRRGLQASGFTVDKRPGFGRKRERLEARLDGSPVTDRPRRVAVIGGGVAGAALSGALRAEGAEVVLVEAAAAGAGASGNPAALVTPRFDAGGGPAAAFFAQAFERAVALYQDTPGAVIARGALQLEAGERDPGRFDRVAAQPLWADGALSRFDGVEAAGRLGDPVASGGLWIRDGLVVENAAVLAAWLADTPVIVAEVAGIARDGTGWRLTDAGGATVTSADAVVIASGWGLAALRPELRMTPARGQAEWVETAARPTPAAWGAYVIPTRDGFLYGATFDRGDTDCAVRAVDSGRNRAALEKVRPTLAAAAEADGGHARARVRATTPDHLPIAGELESGLWVLGGLGSRGFTTAPLLAEHVAAGLLGLPSPLPMTLSRRLEPARLQAPSSGTAAGLD